MAKLTGTNPDQVPTNADLGTMAYQDKDNLQVGDVYADGILNVDGNISVGDHTKILEDDDLKFIAPASTIGVQNARIAWWNENEAGIMAMIGVDRTASLYAPADLVFYTTANVDTAANNSEGDRAERMRIDSGGNVGINTTDPDGYATSSTLLHIAGTASNSGPAGFMMTGQAASQGQAFYSQEVFQVNFSGSATEFCRFTGTGSNGYQAYFKIIVTGHEGSYGNGTTIKEYIWYGGTSSPTQISTYTNAQAPVISFDNSTSNVCIIKLAPANGGGFNGVMKVEWMNPLDFASSTFTVS